MPVFVYPEKEWRELGDVQWAVEWYRFTKGAIARRAADPDYEHDHDFDEVCASRAFPTKAAAMKFAKKLLDDPTLVYGCAMVYKQTVDWYVEEDRIAEWVNVGDGEEVSS